MFAFIFFFILGFSPLADAASKSGGGSSANKVYRLDFFAGAIGGLGSFKETKSSVVTEHSTTSYGADVGFHLGLRVSAFSFGGVAAAAFLTNDGSKKTGAASTGYQYQYSTVQSVAGAFLALSLNGSWDGPELIGEYYPFAYGSVSESEKKSDTETTTSSPFQPRDYMKGTGWGAGVAVNTDKRIRMGVLYRNITYKTLSLSGTTPVSSVTRTNMTQHSVMIFAAHHF